MGKKTANRKPDETAPAPSPEAVPKAAPEGGDLASPVPEGGGAPVEGVDGEVAVSPPAVEGIPDVKPGEPAPGAEASSPAPADPGPSLADYRKLEARVNALAALAFQNYGARV
jgi:hypothetical protein